VKAAGPIESGAAAAPEPFQRTAAPDAPGAPDLAVLLDEPAPRPWYQRPAVWAAALALGLLVGGVAWWQQRKADAAAPVYTTQLMGRGALTLTVTANGTLQPTRSINIGSELSGTVVKVHVDVNDRITKGQVLVELDTAKLRDQVARSQAGVAAAQAKLAQTAATVTEAQATLARYEEVARLSGGKVPSQAELDTARASLARARADQASARASVAEAQATLSTDSINLGKASIRAPSDGVVLTRSVDPGNAVAASLQAVTLFSVAEDLTQLRLLVSVDEADVGSVNAGQAATFTVSAHPGRRFPAKVGRVAFGSTITENVVTYPTQLEVDNSDGSLRPGMSATATITATERRDVLLVPNTALRFSPTAAQGLAGSSAAGAGGTRPAAGGGIVGSLVPRMPRGARRSAGGEATPTGPRQVWVLRDGAPLAVPITTGITDGRMTEVTGGAVEAGMQVITDQKVAAP